MNKIMTKFVDTLLKKADKKPVLRTLEKAFNSGIPFNIPHKFQFLELSDEKIKLGLPYIKKNKNHLGGIHACATATLGEYSAGLSLVKRFGTFKYRLIMEELHVHYNKQAKESLFGVVELDEAEKSRVEMELKNNESCKVEITTKIMTIEEDVIAEVTTKWQLKNWQHVTFK